MIDPNWTSVDIYYWPNGVWCRSWELEGMALDQREAKTMQVLPCRTAEEIARAVSHALANTTPVACLQTGEVASGG